MSRLPRPCSTDHTREMYAQQDKRTITETVSAGMKELRLIGKISFCSVPNMLAIAADATHAKRRQPQRPPQPINLCATSAIFDTALMCLSLTQRSFSHPMQGVSERASVHHFPPSPSGSPHCNGVPLRRSAHSSKKPGDIFRPAASLSPVPHPPSLTVSPSPHFWPQAR